MKQDLVFLTHLPLKRALAENASCAIFIYARCLYLFFYLLFIILSTVACSGSVPQMLRGTGLSSTGSGLLLSLNAGLLETATDHTDAENVRKAMTLLEEEFHRANDGISLRIIVDQPSDALFVMERMSRRYRLGPAPRSALENMHTEQSEKERFHLMNFLAGLQESNPYFIKHEEGIFFLTSGLQLYTGGQVHYDIVILSHPIIEDRADAWICCSLQANMKEYVVLPAPGRSALDGVAVATANNVDQIRVALQRLIGTDSEWKLSSSRHSLFRLYAARNGELDREECRQMTSAGMSIQELEGVQRAAVQESIVRIEKFCTDH